MMRTVWVGAGLAVLALCAACSSGAPASRPTPSGSGTFTVHGTVTVEGISQNLSVAQGATCYPTSGYDDLDPGGQVVVADDDGHTLALGQIGTGEFVADGAVNATSGRCRVPFTVPGVPAGKGFYHLRLGHRNDMTYSEADIAAGPALTIG